MPLITRNSPSREQRLQELMLNRLTSKYERRIRNEIVKTMREVASKYTQDNTYIVSTIIAQHKERLSKIMTPLWLESGKVFSEHLTGVIKASRSFEVKQDEIPLTDIANSVMIQWIRTQGLKKLTQITTTTQNDIRDIITQGINDGLGEKEISKLIRSVAPLLGGSRSQTIARTETHNAANEAAQATAEASGIEMRREWVASGGERTRTTHVEANGQTVGMKEMFTVGGVKLRFPGDSEANAPAETINCRCAVVFVI